MLDPKLSLSLFLCNDYFRDSPSDFGLSVFVDILYIRLLFFIHLDFVFSRGMGAAAPLRV